MGLYRREKVWWIRINFDGRQIRQSTETSNRRLAERIYAKLLTQIVEGKWFEKLPAEDKTLEDLMQKYLEEHSFPNKAVKTAKLDKAIAKDIVKFFGDVPLKKITPKRVALFKARCREKGVAPATTKYRLSVMRHAFNLAIREWEWCKDNPVSRVRMEKFNNARERWLTLDEEDKLLEACLDATRESNPERKTYLLEIVFFALNTGMRQDEILSLEWQNVDLFRKTATVVKSKNGERRTIPLNIGVFEILKKKAKARALGCGYVFPSEAGTKIDERNLRRAFYRALSQVGITDFRFHDLRHTFATRLAQAGVDLYKIAKLLGHKDIKMTQRYSHHYPESLRDGVEVLDRKSTILAQSGLLANSHGAK